MDCYKIATNMIKTMTQKKKTFELTIEKPNILENLRNGNKEKQEDMLFMKLLEQHCAIVNPIRWENLFFLLNLYITEVFIIMIGIVAIYV